MDWEQARQKSRQRYLEFRVEAPKVIRAQGISCVVWAEDALAYYGVPIVPFELFVLVANVDAAARCLKNVGYATEAPRESEPLPELMEGSSDIEFLLREMARNNVRTSLAEVPSATAEFQAWLEDLVTGCTQLFYGVGL